MCWDPYLKGFPPALPRGESRAHEVLRRDAALLDDSIDEVLALCHCAEEAAFRQLGEMAGRANGAEKSLEASSCCGGQAGFPCDVTDSLAAIGGSPGTGKEEEEVEGGTSGE